MFGNPQYPTFQIFLALGIAALIVLVVMPFWIKALKHEGIGQQVRADGPQRHLVKQGTPTMGGTIILLSILLTCLLMAHVSVSIILAIFATFTTGLLGFIDDATSVSQGRSLGLTPLQKMIGLTLICVIFCICAVNFAGVVPEVRFPGGFVINLGSICSFELQIGTFNLTIPVLYLIFVFLLLVGMSNAVNLTDGLDGLAGGTSMMSMLIMAALSFLSDDVNLAVFCASCAGACLGFLWYNAYPASIFMGDTGSLALGAAFASVAVLTNTEVISLIVGGLFIAEALSVIIQVASFKLTGKRVFLMAPIHHHFEKKGWRETQVVTRFWIIAAAFGALGFALFFQLGL